MRPLYTSNSLSPQAIGDLILLFLHKINDRENFDLGAIQQAKGKYCKKSPLKRTNMAIDAEPTLRRRHGESSPDAAHTLLNTVKAVERKIENAFLLAWDELPDWRRDNAFITTGYRPTSNSYRNSFASIFSVHNESVNIWTHLLGAVGFVGIGLTALYLYETVIAPRYATASSTDVLVFGCFFAGAFLCLGMSATYHALCNHSPDVAKWGNKLDYTGIVFLIVGSYMPALYYGFYCLPGLMEVYLSGVSWRPM